MLIFDVVCVMIDDRILISSPCGLLSEDKQDFLTKHNNFCKKYLEEKYQKVRYLKVIDNTSKDYCYKNIDFTIDLLTGEVFANNKDDTIWEMCNLKEEKCDKFSIEKLEKYNNSFFIHKKVVQNAEYTFLDENKNEVVKMDKYSYVINGLDIDDGGYGDYIIMSFLEQDSKIYIKGFNGNSILVNLCKKKYKNVVDRADLLWSFFMSRYTNAEIRRRIYYEFFEIFDEK